MNKSFEFFFFYLHTELLAVAHLRQLVESKTLLKEKARKLQLMLGEM